MTKRITLLLTASVAFLAVVQAAAQDKREAAVAAANDKYVISAKAGGVNYVEGTVTVVRKDGTSGRLLRRDEVEVGDRVSTGPDGKAEVLLNPGSYVRVGANSEFEFKSTSLSDLQVKIYRGSAIFEVFASREFLVRVFTSNAKMLLVDTGVYRIDALPDGGAEIAVWEGKALLNDGHATLLKKGSAATVKIGTTSQLRKISKDDKDELAVWSKSRGKELAKQTDALKNAAMRNSLLNSFNSGLWGMYNSFGLWACDASHGSCRFLPFGYGWYSPYGYGYSSNIWWYHLPTYIIYPPTGGGNPVVTPQRIRPTRGDAIEAQQPVPPFEKMQRTMTITRSSGSSPIDSGPTFRTPGSTGPVFAPSTPSVETTRSTPTESPGTTRSLSKPGSKDN